VITSVGCRDGCVDGKLEDIVGEPMTADAGVVGVLFLSPPVKIMIKTTTTTIQKQQAPLTMKMLLSAYSLMINIFSSKNSLASILYLLYPFSKSRSLVLRLLRLLVRRGKAKPCSSSKSLSSLELSPSSVMSNESSDS